jgi:hypothetical protein
LSVWFCNGKGKGAREGTDLVDAVLLQMRWRQRTHKDTGAGHPGEGGGGGVGRARQVVSRVKGVCKQSSRDRCGAATPRGRVARAEVQDNRRWKARKRNHPRTSSRASTGTSVRPLQTQPRASWSTSVNFWGGSFLAPLFACGVCKRQEHQCQRGPGRAFIHPSHGPAWGVYPSRGKTLSESKSSSSSL